MESAVVDASVVVRWIIVEDLYEQAVAVRDGFLGGDLEVAVPDLLPYEVLNALRYARTVPDPDLAAAAAFLRQAGFDQRALHEHVEETLQLARERDITIYDASYAGLAKHLGRTLLTADEELIDALGDSVVTMHLRDYDSASSSTS
jgi:predicted nucleic acid-binding protein